MAKNSIGQQKQYHVDLERIDLNKLKGSLKKRNMIPSRSILKEKMEERFNILIENGISNLKVLVEALKKKPDVEKFSRKSGLPIDYLTILKREVNSYLPNPRLLKDFPGVASKDLQTLETQGIRNTKQLFNTTRTTQETEKLSKETGIPIDRLAELVSYADLARLYGVGPVFARIILDAGIGSVGAFIKLKAEEFIAIYEKKTGKKTDFSVDDINFSIELGRELLN